MILNLFWWEVTWWVLFQASKTRPVKKMQRFSVKLDSVSCIRHIEFFVHQARAPIDFYAWTVKAPLAPQSHHFFKPLKSNPFETLLFEKRPLSSSIYLPVVYWRENWKSNLTAGSKQDFLLGWAIWLLESIHWEHFFSFFYPKFLYIESVHRYAQYG